MRAGRIRQQFIIIIAIMFVCLSAVRLSYAGSSSTYNEKNKTNILLKRMSRLSSSSARQLSLDVADDAGDLCSSRAMSSDRLIM
jgi:hypothetical protein